MTFLRCPVPASDSDWNWSATVNEAGFTISYRNHEGIITTESGPLERPVLLAALERLSALEARKTVQTAAPLGIMNADEIKDLRKRLIRALAQHVIDGSTEPLSEALIAVERLVLPGTGKATAIVEAQLLSLAVNRFILANSSLESTRLVAAMRLTDLFPTRNFR